MTTVNYSISDPILPYIDKLELLTQNLGYNHYVINSPKSGFDLIRIDHGSYLNQVYRLIENFSEYSLIRYDSPDGDEEEFMELVDTMMTDRLTKKRLSRYQDLCNDSKSLIKAVKYLETKSSSEFYQLFIQYLCSDICKKGYSNILDIIATPRNYRWIFSSILAESKNISVVYQIFNKFKDIIVEYIDDKDNNDSKFYNGIELNLNTIIDLVGQNSNFESISTKIRYGHKLSDLDKNNIETLSKILDYFSSKTNQRLVSIDLSTKIPDLFRSQYANIFNFSSTRINLFDDRVGRSRPVEITQVRSKRLYQMYLTQITESVQLYGLEGISRIIVKYL